LSGNPLAMTAGFETLSIIDETPDFYAQLEEKSKYLADGIKDGLKKLNLNYRVNRTGSMLTLFFTDAEVTDFDTAKRSDTRKFSDYFGAMLESGIYLPPSQFEAWFVSFAHTKEDLDKTIAANFEALGKKSR